ncbi:MAG: hypothetical protein EXS36_04400 [Pedosphaera sp.]|nr:hypothetical protein [Pedosphaera sp.]
MPKNSRYAEGYNGQWQPDSAFLGISDRLLSMRRDPAKSHKIGSDSGTLLWVGERFCLRIDAPRILNSHYPDNESSVEIYTNGDPLQYVELETLGPLKRMKIGDRISARNTYTLYRRTQLAPQDEARAILGQPGI